MNINKMTTKERAAYNRMNGIITMPARIKRNGKAMNEVYQNDWMWIEMDKEECENFGECKNFNTGTCMFCVRLLKDYLYDLLDEKNDQK